MDRAQLVLVGLPIFLFCTDIFSLFTPKPPKTSTHYHVHDDEDPQPLDHPDPQHQQLLQEPLNSPPSRNLMALEQLAWEAPSTLISVHPVLTGSAVTMKNMLGTAFPGINVILANHPPPLPRRLLSKLVPVFQVGIIGTIMAGEHIFSRLGITTPPPWYHSLKANRFGSIASTWILGNFIQSFLQSTGAFEVYCNGELVFSKLKERRFPSEIELRDLVGKKLGSSRTADGPGGGAWS
ncbi:SELT-like protein precursor [Prunus dulcis]|uniref:SELT-like protein n=1 Tax=Prunus dulcis TaxID=3755 RepID=A0A4Y1RRA7_PRUDU|nr:SELT-like protein precursor [Prunus dulcis]